MIASNPAAAYDIFANAVKDDRMAAGKRLISPASRLMTVQLQPDVVIEPHTHLRGKTSVESGSAVLDQAAC